MELVQEIVHAVILTGRIFSSDPVSLMLIAPVEQGKTSVIAEHPCKSALFLSDVTGKGIQQICKMNESVTHFVINDLVSVGAKKNSVNKFTFAMLSAVCEEGIQAVAYPNGVEVFDKAKGKRGFIACLPSNLVNDDRRWWRSTGFASRCLPFFFTHSNAMKVKIHTAISSGDLDKRWEPGEPLKVPEMRLHVGMDKKRADQIRRIANTISHNLGETGYRRHHQCRALARAHAILRSPNWKGINVGQPDIDFLLRITPYVSYTKACAL